MKIKINKVHNGYLVVQHGSLDLMHGKINAKRRAVFANLESALSFIKKEFGESDET